jgi:hypothetical protein
VGNNFDSHTGVHQSAPVNRKEVSGESPPKPTWSWKVVLYSAVGVWVRLCNLRYVRRTVVVVDV